MIRFANIQAFEFFYLGAKFIVKLKRPISFPVFFALKQYLKENQYSKIKELRNETIK